MKKLECIQSLFMLEKAKKGRYLISTIYSRDYNAVKASESINLLEYNISWQEEISCFVDKTNYEPFITESNHESFFMVVKDSKGKLQAKKLAKKLKSNNMDIIMINTSIARKKFVAIIDHDYNKDNQKEGVVK